MNDLELLSSSKSTVVVYRINYGGVEYTYTEYFDGRKFVDSTVAADYHIENEDELKEIFGDFVDEMNGEKIEIY